MGIQDQLQIAERDTVWVAGTGSHEYNLAVSGESDFDVIQFVYPTFKDLYEGKRYLKDLCAPENMIDLKTYDYRDLPELLYKQSLDILQLLYASYSDVSPFALHTGGLKKILTMRDKIVRMNLFKFYKSQYHSIQHRVKRFVKDYEQRGDGSYDGKEMVFIHRTATILMKFADEGFETLHNLIYADDLYRAKMLDYRNNVIPGDFAVHTAQRLLEDMMPYEYIYQEAHEEYSLDGEILKEELHAIVEADVKEYILMYPNKI